MARLTDRRLFQLPWRSAGRIRADVDDEIRFDLDMRTAALVVLMTIALGIGANTAVFSVVRSVLLARLPYREPDRLVRLYGTAPGKPNAQGMLTPVEISAVQQSRALTGVGVWGWFGGVTYVGDRSTEQWESVQVTPDFFHVLGVR